MGKKLDSLTCEGLYLWFIDIYNVGDLTKKKSNVIVVYTINTQRNWIKL